MQYKKTSETDYTSEEVTAYNDVYTITDGSYIFAADKESTYDITLIVEDAFGYIDRYTTGSSERVLWSRLWKGLGLAIGKIAELEGVFEVGFLTKLTGGLINPVIPNDTDLNDVITPNVYAANARNAANLKNCPVPDGNSFTLEVMSSGHVGQILQRITTCSKTAPNVYERHYYDGEWGEWIDKVSELNSKLINIFNAEQLSLTITNGDNYSSVEGNVYQIGNILRVYVKATRSSAPSIGNVGNEIIATFTCNHNGKISNGYNTSGGAYSSGGVIGVITSNSSCDDTTLSFNISLTSTTTDDKAISAMLIMPVDINIDAF